MRKTSSTTFGIVCRVVGERQEMLSKSRALLILMQEVSPEQYAAVVGKHNRPDASHRCWRKGSREFIATHLTFCFEFGSGAPAGAAKVRDVITLSDDGEEFTGRQFVEAFDAAGELVFSANILMHGVRLRAEAPPPLP